MGSSSVEKGIAGLVAVLMLTTLVLPGRQTPRILDSLFGGLSKLSSAAIASNR
jgi:hypothetical protein